MSGNGPFMRGGRQRDVHVERDAVQGLDARQQRARAELHAPVFGILGDRARDLPAEDRSDRRGARGAGDRDEEAKKAEQGTRHGAMILPVRTGRISGGPDVTVGNRNRR